MLLLFVDVVLLFARCVAGPVDVSRFHLKAVFAWIPEYLWPDIVEFVPCPNCGGPGKPDGWTPQQPRRAFLEDGIGYIIGFRYVAGVNKPLFISSFEHAT